MTVEEIKTRLADIAASSTDPEVAHNMEDALLLDTLKAIAADAAEPRALAAAAAEAENLDFPRWCA